MDSFIYVYSLFGPFLLWPIEKFVPYPYFVEEIFKAVVVYTNSELKAKHFFLAGVLFALTETILYTINVNIVGGVGLMLTRFALTSLLHSLTFVVIYLFMKVNKKMITVGLLASVLIHFLYNKLIPSFVWVIP